MAKEKHECPRCGNQWEARTHAYYDELVEWIHHCAEIEQDYKRIIARLHNDMAHMSWDLDYYKSLAGYLVVPNLEQIELMALRGQIAELQQGGPLVERVDEPVESAPFD